MLQAGHPFSSQQAARGSPGSGPSTAGRQRWKYRETSTAERCTEEWQSNGTSRWKGPEESIKLAQEHRSPRAHEPTRFNHLQIGPPSFHHHLEPSKTSGGKWANSSLRIRPGMAHGDGQARKGERRDHRNANAGGDQVQGRGGNAACCPAQSHSPGSICSGRPASQGTTFRAQSCLDGLSASLFFFHGFRYTYTAFAPKSHCVGSLGGRHKSFCCSSSLPLSFA
ncbi:hypothetical protein QBC39DRAFT_353423 [Podospora conica]|nr:hypothetical protein QBC39DRAFT_353423 [Schizothecium conicum]